MFQRHVFVCLQNRPPFAKPSCGPRGSPRLLELLTTELEKRGLFGRIGLNGSTCLGPCESGPNMVVYPEGVWYAGVKPEDVPEIVEQHLAGGRPVERLRYRPPAAPGA